MDREKKLRANIEIKPAVDGNHWYVAGCSADIENKVFYAHPPGEFFPSKDVAITTLMGHIMGWFKGKGRKETEEEVEWRVP
jgi:hypothetical protein